MKIVMRPPQDGDRNEYIVKTAHLIESEYIPLLMSHGCELLEGEKILAVRHDFFINIPFIQRLVSGEDTVSHETVVSRLLK